MLWQELGAIRGICEEPWCLGGDFNIIIHPAEANRGGFTNVISSPNASPRRARNPGR